MSKTTTELHDLPLTQETPATQTHHETFNAFLNAPVTKLDADEYMAKDIDGVTEGLLGSGNLNFLMMQAGQTDEAMTNANPFDIAHNDMSMGGAGLLSGNSFTPIAGMGAQNDLSTDRPVDSFAALDGLTNDGTGGQSNMMVTLGASSAAANSQSANPFSDTGYFSNVTSGSNGTNGNDGNNGNGSNGLNGTSGTNGANGTNGTDGEGGGTTIVNNNYNEENTYIDNSIINNTDIDIFDETFLENVENIYNETTNFLTELTENTFSTVNNVINNIFNGNPLDIGPIGLNLDAALDDLLDLDLELINGDQILTVLDEVIEAALDLAAAMEEIHLLPQGLETRINRYGIANLPGNLALRLSLARLYLHTAPILLIDEIPNTILSGKEGRNLRDYLARAKGKRTCLMITYREDFLKMADTLVYLRRGEVPLIGETEKMMNIVMEAA